VRGRDVLGGRAYLRDEFLVLEEEKKKLQPSSSFPTSRKGDRTSLGKREKGLYDAVAGWRNRGVPTIWEVKESKSKQYQTIQILLHHGRETEEN